MDRAEKIAYLRDREAARAIELRDMRADQCRRSLAAFVRQAIAAGVVVGISRVDWGPHLERYCRHVQDQIEGWIVANQDKARGMSAGLLARMVERQRDAWEWSGASWEDGKPEPWLRYVLAQNTVDNLPPGTLKSTIVMVCACAWIWLHCPTFSFGAASGMDANVTRDSNATRDLVRSAWYRETFAIVMSTDDIADELEDLASMGIRSDADSVSDWSTTLGGRRYSRTVHRGFTGLHVDGIFLDDPDDAERVFTESARVLPQNRFTRAIENRVNDEHRSIRKVLQQVVHPQGFTAYLLSVARWDPARPKGWVWFCLAAEYGMQPADAPTETPYGPVDWRTTPGELLHERLSAGVLADKRNKLGASVYEAQYNQNARTTSEGMFERRHARFFSLEDTNLALLRRRPDGAPAREDQPPTIIKLQDLRHLTLSVDANNSLNPKPRSKASAVGLMVAGCIDDHRFVLDDRTKVLGPSGIYTSIYELLRTYHLERVLVELKALGAAVIDTITAAIRRGWYIDPVTDEKVLLLGPDGRPVRAVVEPYDPGKSSKPQRAAAALPVWEEGRIHLLDGAPWLYAHVDGDNKTVDEGFFEEWCSFTSSGTGSRRSDRVDSMSQFLARYAGPVQTARSRWGALSRV